MLTRKQHDLLLFIDERLKEKGVSPSFDEMKEALGLKSKSGIHRLITALEERGFIRRLPHKARALEVVRLPQEAAGQEGGKVVTGLFQKKPVQSDLTEIPLHGKIAAGTPIEALENVDRHIAMPPDMLGRGSYYALEVSGDSMIDEGIMDGDTVLIERCENAHDGQIVVALVDENEATLKRFRRRGPDVHLIPANSEHQTQILAPNRVRVQGRLVGLLRRY
ncbi:MAG: transcriptional repressor LexA [Sphingomonadales bacterium]|jgi:repressor LexA